MGHKEIFYWNKAAKTYNSRQDELISIYQPVVDEFTGCVSGMRILDAGCGDGRLAINLASRGATDYTFEFVGLVGSALMLGGVLLIKPVFVAVRNAEEKQRALSESLQESMDQIRMLKELLPICASCKKIRDESGCWHSVEKYISDYTATKFSHGLCPECLRIIYPDYCDKIQ